MVTAPSAGGGAHPAGQSPEPAAHVMLAGGIHGFPIELPVLSRGAADRSEDLRSAARIAAAWPTARIIAVDDDGRTSVVGGDPVRLAYRSAASLGAGPPHQAVLLGTVPVDGPESGSPDNDDLPAGRGPAGSFVDYWAVPGPVDVAAGTADPDRWSNGEVRGDGVAAGGARSSSLREVGALLSDTDAGLFTAAVAVLTWHRHGGFCPRCGLASESRSAGWSRICPNEHQEFPRTDPAVIVLVHDGADNMVLARQPSWPAGRVSVLAGFTEAGESLEGTVYREISEEIGVRVTDIGYLGSQPWPFPRSLMVGFSARAQAGAILAPRAGEIESAHWVDRATVRRALAAGGTADGIGLPPSISIARRMIEAWAAMGG